jgi:hypothetical protein
MHNFLNRLRTAYLVLFSPRYLLFVPISSHKATVGEGGTMSANAWASLALFAEHRTLLARAEAEARLLAEMAEEARRLQAIEDDINAILSND